MVGHAAVAVADRYMYVFGGLSQYEYLTFLYRWDYATEFWSRIHAQPARLVLCVCVPSNLDKGSRGLVFCNTVHGTGFIV